MHINHLIGIAVSKHDSRIQGQMGWMERQTCDVCNRIYGSFVLYEESGCGYPSVQKKLGAQIGQNIISRHHNQHILIVACNITKWFRNHPDGWCYLGRFNHDWHYCLIHLRQYGRLFDSDMDSISCHWQ